MHNLWKLCGHTILKKKLWVTKVWKVVKFWEPTWPIFAGPVTFKLNGYTQSINLCSFSLSLDCFMCSCIVGNIFEQYYEEFSMKIFQLTTLVLIPCFEFQKFEVFTPHKSFWCTTIVIPWPSHTSKDLLELLKVVIARQQLRYCPISSGSVNYQVSSFLFKYTVTPHSTTRAPPTELMLNLEDSLVQC